MKLVPDLLSQANVIITLVLDQLVYTTSFEKSLSEPALSFAVTAKYHDLIGFGGTIMLGIKGALWIAVCLAIKSAAPNP